MEMAKNLDYQRLESSLNLGLFMDFAHKTLSQPLTSSESEHSDFEATASGGKWKNGLKTTRQGKCFPSEIREINMCTLKLKILPRFYQKSRIVYIATSSNLIHNLPNL